MNRLIIKLLLVHVFFYTGIKASSAPLTVQGTSISALSLDPQFALSSDSSKIIHPFTGLTSANITSLKNALANGKIEVQLFFDPTDKTFTMQVVQSDGAILSFSQSLGQFWMLNGAGATYTADYSFNSLTLSITTEAKQQSVAVGNTTRFSMEVSGSNIVVTPLQISEISLAADDNLSKVQVSLVFGSKVVEIPFSAAQLTALQNVMKADQESAMVFATLITSGSEYGAQIYVQQSTGKSLSGFPVTLSKIETVSGESIGTKTPLAGQYVEYQTTNMNVPVMFKANHQQFFTDQELSLFGDESKPTESLVKVLQALSATQKSSAVDIATAIKTYAKGQNITINQNSWNDVFGPSINTAGLSTMSAAVKTALDITPAVPSTNQSGGGGRFG